MQDLYEEWGVGWGTNRDSNGDEPLCLWIWFSKHTQILHVYRENGGRGGWGVGSKGDRKIHNLGADANLPYLCPNADSIVYVLSRKILEFIRSLSIHVVLRLLASFHTTPQTGHRRKREYQSDSRNSSGTTQNISSIISAFCQFFVWLSSVWFRAAKGNIRTVRWAREIKSVL